MKCPADKTACGNCKGAGYKTGGAFADEPTGNLDAENAESVAAILSRASMRYGQTIVMVTHDRQMADYADRILSMENIVACMK